MTMHPTTTTTLGIPPLADILDLVKERHATAVQHDDYAGAGQLNRVRMNLGRGAHLAWSLGDLLIQSVNNPGQVYSVNRAGCTCPNGRAGKAACWHVALYDLLLDMADDRAALADLLADAAAARQELDDDPPELRGLRQALDEAARALGPGDIDDGPIDPPWPLPGDEAPRRYETAGLGRRIAAARARLAA
jgi:hypothetical protein